MKTRVHFALAFFFYSTIAIALPSAWAQEQIPLRLVHDTFAVASIQINGEGSFDFILDTGADTTIVDRTLASRLALVPIDHMTLTTPVDKQTLVRSSLRMVSLGSVTVFDVEVLVQEMPTVRKLDSRIHGILGQNFLSHFNYLLDYHQRLVRFESQNELRDSATGTRVPLEVASARMMIQVDIPVLDLDKLHMLLDSGTSDLVLFRRMAQLTTPMPGGSSMIANAWRDSREITTHRINSLVIGDQHFYDIKLAFLTSDTREPPPEDGLLPTSMFRALYVNNRERFVILNPKVSRPAGRER